MGKKVTFRPIVEKIATQVLRLPTHILPIILGSQK